MIVARPLRRAEWTERAARHEARADALTAAHRDRATRSEKHPVWDFLFTYYAYKPALLRRWHPGAGVALENAPERADWRWYNAACSDNPAGPEGKAEYVRRQRDFAERGAALRERMLQAWLG